MVAFTLLHKPQAWMLVLQWAGDKLEFPQLANSMTHHFGDWYNPAEWKEVFNHVFLCSDPGEDIEDAHHIPMAIATIEAAMASRGVTVTSTRPARSSTANSKGKGKRKATDNPHCSRPKKRMRHIPVNKFFDIEVQVDMEDELSKEDEDLGEY